MKDITTIYILLTILVVGVLAIIGYFLFYKTEDIINETSNTTIEGSDSSPDEVTDRSSLRNIILTKNNVRCSWTAEENEYNGVIYIHDESFFQTQASSATSTSYTLYTNPNNMLYTWSSSGDIGVALEVEGFSTFNSESTQLLDENVNFICNDWIVDPDILEPPQDIQFETIPLSIEGATAT